MKSSLYLAQLQIDLGYLHHDLIHHPAFKQIIDIPTLSRFIEHHIFAVWSFMQLQAFFYPKMAGAPVPELPLQYAESLFEDYRRVMTHCGVNKNPMDTFLMQLKSKPLLEVLSTPGIPVAARIFIERTYALWDAPIHRIAAAFVFAREGIINNPFHQVLQKNHTGHFSIPSGLQDYLQSHIDVENDSQCPKTLPLLEYVCGEESAKWQEATQAARETLQAQYDFWAAVHSTLLNPQE